MQKSSFVFARYGVLVALFVAAGVSGLAQSDEKAAVEWTRQNAIPLKTVEAGNGFADMEPLGNVVGDARIVELGEATHGTREFFQLKHRMVEYLASQKGFTLFSIEANMPEAYRLNKFVLDGEGDPKQLLKGMYFWTWDTEEVLNMILWMRDFNKSGKGRIEFTGFDMQTPTVSIATVRDFLLARDAAYYHSVVEAVYVQAPRLEQQQQQSFGVATAHVAGGLCAGKHVVLSGYLRTEDIANGGASLWMRADGDHRVLGFINLGEKSVTGTTPWTRYEIALDVPANATMVYFGATQAGSGTAWLDSIDLKIDGKPYQDAAFDFGFEASTPKGFYTGGQGYEVAIDKSVAQSGSQSLRMRRVAAPAPPPDAKVDAAALLEKCGDVVKFLEKNREQYVQAGAAARDVDWAIQNARLVLQYVELKAGTQSRDESMAKNIEWIVQQNPGAKVMVWAHNGHVSNSGFSGTHSMGGYLRAVYGTQMVNFGFAFNEGSFRAVEQGQGLHEFTVGPAPEGTLDHALAETGIPLFAIDLRGVPRGTAAAKWFAEAHKSRSVGSMYGDALADSLWSPGPAKTDFDVLLFVEKTTAARGNH